MDNLKRIKHTAVKQLAAFLFAVTNGFQKKDIFLKKITMNI